MNAKYSFDPAEAYTLIESHWQEWAKKFNDPKWVVGISGGKDSTVVAYLAAKIFGPENVYGVMMPNGLQHDIADSESVIRLTSIQSKLINVSDAFHSIRDAIENNGIEVSHDTVVNLAPRLRMAALYAVAQSVNGVVLNTSNLTEDILGYATLWGDTCGSYAPIQNLTVTEVIKLGEWLGIPENLIRKPPADGLQGVSDEEKLGMKYADVDRLIREDIGSDELRVKVAKKYCANKFKIDMIALDKPSFPGWCQNFVSSITSFKM